MPPAEAGRQVGADADTDTRAGTPRRWLLPRWGLPAVLAVGLVARLHYWYLTREYVPASDAESYRALAENVADGRGVADYFPQLAEHPTAFRPPLFPGVLGALYAVVGDTIVAGRMLNLVLGLAAVALTVLVVRRLAADLRAALVAGLLVAVFPPIVANDVVLLTEPLSIVLLLGAVLALLDERPLVAGFLVGLLVLARTSAQLLIPVVVVWALWRLGWRRAVQLGLVAAVVVAPWVVRNQVQLGEPTLATSNGFNLAAMYGEPALRAGHFVDPVFSTEYDHVRLLQFDEAAWDAELRSIGLESIREHPRAAAQVPVRNLLMLLELHHAQNDWAELMDGRNETMRDWAAPLVPLLAVAGTAGLWLRRRHPGVVLLAGLGAYFLLASMLVVAAPRLRAPVDVVWCIGVGLLAAGRSPTGAAPRAPSRATAAVTSGPPA